MKVKFSISILLGGLLLFACTATTLETTVATDSSSASPMEVNMSITLTSNAFVNGQSIPAKYSCLGKEVSPPLSWTEPPAGTKSFAFIMDDPDAPMGTWVHWIVFNIPASSRGLPEDASFNDGSAQGTNSGGDRKYGGPCPPSGTHRYYFKLYALDVIFNLGAGTDKSQLLKAMQGHILAQGELMGTFSK